MIKVALVGNPNSGKTTLFNGLTGSTAHVGNWPGVTVDKKEGIYKKGQKPVVVVDLPGIYSLSPYTQEEVIARNYILDEKPDCVINIIDTTNLERNLYLTTQIMEIDVPIVLALNMMDEIEKRGDSIDIKELEKNIGLPVVKISALKGTGLDKLMEATIKASSEKRKAKTVLEESPLKHLVNDLTIALSGQNVDNPVFHAVKLAELDDLEVLMHKDTVEMVNAFKASNFTDSFNGDFEALVADARYKYIEKHYSPCLIRKKQEKFASTKSDKIDKVLTHKVWGIPIFLAILFAIFHLTFSENFLFLGGALGEDFVILKGTAFEGVFGEGAIYSLGVIFTNLLSLLTDTILGAVSNLLSGVSPWVSGLICDGILGGIFAVLGFLPQILLLFAFFSILEDSGYMARIAFILDRMLRKFGLSGRAFLPMIMGFGCSVPAIINTRTLADEKEKIATIRVIPFFSCMAKLPILTAVGGAIIIKGNLTNGYADIITYGMYLLGIITALISVIIMRNTTQKGTTPPFIMELPTYRKPQLKSLIVLLWEKAKHFIEKAFTIILASTILIWVFSHFSFTWEFLPEEEMSRSILAGLSGLIQPLFTPLGFGSQLSNFGWVFALASITGLVAKENVVATIGSLAVGLGFLDVSGLFLSTGITIPALLAFIAFNMTTIPCFATVSATKGELPNKKTFKFTIFFWLLASFIVSSAIYFIGTWWWTCFVYVTLVVITMIIVKFSNKKSRV